MLISRENSCIVKSTGRSPGTSYTARMEGDVGRFEFKSVALSSCGILVDSQIYAVKFR